MHTKCTLRENVTYISQFYARQSLTQRHLGKPTTLAVKFDSGLLNLHFTTLLTLLFLKQELQVGLNGGSKVPRMRMEAIAWNAVLVDEELLEVPDNVVRQDRRPEDARLVADAVLRRRARSLQVLEQRMRSLSVDLEFPIDFQVRMRLPASTGAHVLQDRKNFGIGRWFLQAELVARKSERKQATVTAKYGIKITIRLIGLTSEGRYIADHHDSVLVFFKGFIYTVQSFDDVVVNVRSSRCLADGHVTLRRRSLPKRHGQH